MVMDHMFILRTFGGPEAADNENKVGINLTLLIISKKEPALVMRRSLCFFINVIYVNDQKSIFIIYYYDFI